MSYGPSPDTNKAACLQLSIIQVKPVPFNSPSSSDLPGLSASLMIYLLGMKLSRDSVSLENTAIWFSPLLYPPGGRFYK